MKTKLTEKGLRLLVGALAGEKLQFTKLTLGNGISEGGDTIINPLFDVGISDISIENGYAIITTRFDNNTLESGFRVTEAGVYALDGEDEVLYAVAFTDESTADYIPGKDERLLELQYDYMVFVSEVQDVSTAINGTIIFASAADLEKHTGNRENPHCVTKKQVGLSEVPNVATNDQTPTFAETAVLSELKSGEKLSLLFSKTAYAVKSFISHIANKANPHKVTASQIGASPKKHTHSTSDINSGILNVERGGTGVASIEALAAQIAPQMLVTGAYVGNGKHQDGDYNNGTVEDQIIDLGFYPQAVFVFSPQGYTYVSQIGAFGGFAYRGHNCVTEQDFSSDPDSYVYRQWFSRSRIGVVENGIRVGHRSNISGFVYYYIAFR